MNSLSCRQLDLRIGATQVTHGLDLHFEPGSFWGILGSNGAGKTTLLRCMAGLLRAQAGDVLLDSVSVTDLSRRTLARKLGMLQQHTAYIFDSTVLQVALTGRHPHLAYWQSESRIDVEKAQSALAAVNLEGFWSRSVVGLSGGEARRLAFAALLVQEPAIMLLDEPTNHLDLRHQLHVMNMIQDRTRDSNATAIASLHDVNLASRYCSHVLMLLGGGEWVAGLTAELLNESSLQRLYGCAVEKLEGKGGPKFFPLVNP